MRILTVLVLGVMMLAMVSCAGSGKLAETMSVRHYQAPDVPVPANFTLSHKDSYAYVTNNIRTTSIKYEGSDRTDNLVEFYRHQMPTFGWMEKMTQPAEHMQTITFVKGKEKCDIVIEQLPTETDILIKIGYNN